MRAGFGPPSIAIRPRDVRGRLFVLHRQKVSIMSLSAYRRTLKDTETPRQIERRVLVRVTSDIAAYADRHDAAENRMERLGVLSDGLRDALFDNVRLWSTLKADVLNPGNQLPAELRGSLAGLATFVERHTSTVLGGEGRVAALLDINRPIIAGLSGQATESA